MTKQNLYFLTPLDSVIQDAEPIATMYRNLGTDAADRIISRAVSELALSLTGLQSRVAKHELDDLARPLRKLEQMAENLGLVSLANVSTDLRASLENSDFTAFSAIWARLLRVAERSLAFEKHAPDRSKL